MTLIKYNPWSEMNSLQHELNRLFKDSFPAENWQNWNKLSKIPSAELSETEDTFYLKLELPGIKTSDLDIQVMAEQVAISGERKSETSSKENGTTKSEFYYGKFQRTIPLPKRIQNTNVTADYKDGILNLTLPKSEEEKNKVVKVNLGEATK